MLVKVTARKNGRCRKNSRYVKGRKGCYRQSGSSMSGNGKKKK